MSQKPKKVKAAVKKEPKALSQNVAKPSGHPPAATVSSRHGGEMVLRTGKGFSLGEIRGAGLHFHTAKDWGLPIDFRRRSVLDGNVSSVKGWAARSKPAGRPEGEAEKIEEEVVKLEKEVKKVVGRAKREAKKVEKEVVEKVGEPVKSRGRRKDKAAKKTD